MKTKNVPIFVGLSGGVDSAVSALLLKEQGFRVHGLFMKNWEEDDTATYCPAQTDLDDVKNLCKTLDIPLHTVNFAQEYWQDVFSLFLEEYQKGHTPNPDILCNKEIKFKAFLKHALQLGADYIATGHYAQKVLVDQPGFNPEYQLLRGQDQNKDQSYFLYTLGQEALAKSLFPIGKLEKPMVRLLAKQAKLHVFDKKDSTGICFIGERKFATFLKDYLPCQQGLIKTPEGKTISQHEGLMFYTLGQRHGLKIGGVKGSLEKPWYVVGKDIENNILYVSQDEDHPWQKCVLAKATKLHWVSDHPLPTSFTCTAKVRYRQNDQPCTVYVQQDSALIKFEHAQRSVTPGQGIVFYDKNQCLGGGTLSGTDSPGGIIQSKLSMQQEYL